MKLPDSFFTQETLLTINGTSFLVFMLVTFLAPPEGKKKWIGGGLAWGLAFYIAYISNEAGTTKWLVAVANGLLIYATSLGYDTIVLSKTRKRNQKRLGTRKTSIQISRYLDRMLSPW